MGNWWAASRKGQTSAREKRDSAARGIFHLSARQATSAHIYTQTCSSATKRPVPALCPQMSLPPQHHTLLGAGTNACKTLLAQQQGVVIWWGKLSQISAPRQEGGTAALTAPWAHAAQALKSGLLIENTAAASPSNSN